MILLYECIGNDFIIGICNKWFCHKNALHMILLKKIIANDFTKEKNIR